MLSSSLTEQSLLPHLDFKTEMEQGHFGRKIDIDIFVNFLLIFIRTDNKMCSVFFSQYPTLEIWLNRHQANLLAEMCGAVIERNAALFRAALLPSLSDGAETAGT